MDSFVYIRIANSKCSSVHYYELLCIPSGSRDFATFILACLLRITLYSAWSYCCNETSVSVVYIITTMITDKLARK